MGKKMMNIVMAACLILFLTNSVFASNREERREKELKELQERFSWWPTDATPGPVKDPERGGYWWWPKNPGKVMPWGNRGYVYVYRIIYDYKAPDEEVVPDKTPEVLPVKPPELKPSLLVRKIIKNVKVYFDYDKAVLRDDTLKMLEKAVVTLKRNPEASILITGNCDIRGSEAYNNKLGKRRGDAVKKFMLENGIPEERICIISRGKLDAIAPVSDLAGMQKDRNAQFMIAEVEEVMIPAPELPKIQEEAKSVEEGKYVIEEKEDVESAVKVSQKEYVIKKGDSLWKIAEKELGSGYRSKYLYELNKDRIKSPNKLKVGQKIIIPIE